MPCKILYISLLVVACGGQSLDVGTTDPGGAGGSGGTGAGGTSGTGPHVTLPSWPTPTDCVSSSTLDVVGTWEGAIRGASFETLVPLRLEVHGASEGAGVCGTLLLGEESPPPPPIDPERTWPRNADTGFGGYPGSFFHEGVAYTLTDGAVSLAQMRFTIQPQEAWKYLCAQQTSYFHPTEGSYKCLPPHDGISNPPDGASCGVLVSDGEPLVMDGLTCGLCSLGICVCDEVACTASPKPYHHLGFDLDFDDDTITGSVTGIDAPRFLGVPDAITTDVLLTRVE
jgi:hypothetical protein